VSDYHTGAFAGRAEGIARGGERRGASALHGPRLAGHHACVQPVRAYDPKPSVTEDLPAHLARRTTRSALVSGAAEMASRTLTVALSIIAARLLGPGEVGVLGVAVTVVTILSVALYFWETAAVVSNEPVMDGQQALAATALRLGAALLVSAAILAFRSTLARFFTTSGDLETKVFELLGILLWTLLLEAASCYPRVVLQRRLDLQFLGWLQLASAGLFVALALGLLLAGRGTVGIATAQLASTALAALGTWLRLPDRSWPGWPGRATFAGITRGTGRLFVGGFLGFLGTRTDNIIVAGSIGAVGMSFYSMAYNASRVPHMILEKAIMFVLTPTLARIRDDAPRVERALEQTLAYCYLLVTPVAIAMFLLATPLTLLLLGASWSPLVPCLRIMCWAMLLAPLMYTSGALLVAHGRGEWLGYPAAAMIVVQLLAIPPAARAWGPAGAAAIDFCSFGLVTAGLWVGARRLAPALRWRAIPALSLPLLAGAASFGVSVVVGAVHRGAESPAWAVGTMTLTYLALIWCAGGRERLRTMASLLAERP
jgi:O-antigen/teichoic acid export membrane protein